MSSASPRIALFIDGPNLYATAKSLGFDIDYKRFLGEFQGRGALLRAFYYTATIEDQEFSSIRPLVDWLDYNGYTLVTKAIKEYVDAPGRRKVKGDMHVELAVHAMELAAQIDEMILFSGDVISARSSRRCSAAVSASPWSPASPPNRQWPPTNSGARRISSPT
jgi:uncharacterized LabA/DUF88 family protein